MVLLLHLASILIACVLVLSMGTALAGPPTATRLASLAIDGGDAGLAHARPPAPASRASLPTSSVAPVEQDLEEARRFRRTCAFPQAFRTLKESLDRNGFRPDLAQAVIDTVLASDDGDAGLEIAAGLGGLAGRVLAAHVSLVTTDEAPTEALEDLLDEEPVTGEARAPEIYEHLEAVARRTLGESNRGRALMLLIRARHAAGLDCREPLRRLTSGPASWSRQLGDYLAEADPLEPKDGDYRLLVERLASSRRALAGDDPTGKLASALEEQVRSRPGPSRAAAALMVLRARLGDRVGAAACARRAAGFLTAASPGAIRACAAAVPTTSARSAGPGPGTTPPAPASTPSPRETPVPSRVIGASETPPLEPQRLVRLADLMGRSGMAEEATALLTPLEKVLWREVATTAAMAPSRVHPSEKPAADSAKPPGGQPPASLAALVEAELGVLAALERHDDRALDCLRRSLEAGSDPVPALKCLERLGSLAACRPRVIEILDSAASAGAMAIATAARILERAGDAEGALARYRKVLSETGDSVAPVRAARLELALGRQSDALDVLAGGLRARPADPSLLAEFKRIASPLGRADLTLATLAKLHPHAPADHGLLVNLLDTFESLATGPAERTALTTLLTAWTSAGAAAPEVRAELAHCELASGNAAKARELALSCRAQPPADLHWSRMLLQVVCESAPGQLPATAVRAILPPGRQGWSAYYLARARSLSASRRVTAALHAGLLALDYDPASPEVASALIRLIDAYPHPGYLMGAFYLKTRGNPMYAPFQARYHASVKDCGEAQAYYRSALKAFPEDTALKLEYAAWLRSRGIDKRAAQVYTMLGERMGWRYDKCWGPPLVRIALGRGDAKLYLDSFARWLVQGPALELGILRTFVRLSRQAGLAADAVGLLERLNRAEPRLVTLYDALALFYREQGRAAEADERLAAREQAVRSPDAELAGVYLEEPPQQATR